MVAKRTLIPLLVSVLLVQILLISSAQTLPPNFADCMSNPFATGCRGISAKRSQAPIAGETIGKMMEPGGDRLRRPRYLSLAELLARRWPEAEGALLLEPNLVYRLGD